MEWDLDLTILPSNEGPHEGQTDSYSSSDSGGEEEIRNESGKITTKDSVPDTTVGSSRIEATEAICAILASEDKKQNPKNEPSEIFVEMEKIIKEIGIVKKSFSNKYSERIKLLQQKLEQIEDKPRKQIKSIKDKEMSAHHVAIRMAIAMLFEIIEDINHDSSQSNQRVCDRILRVLQEVVDKSQLSSSMFSAIETEVPMKDLMEKTVHFVQEQTKNLNNIELCRTAIHTYLGLAFLSGSLKYLLNLVYILSNFPNSASLTFDLIVVQRLKNLRSFLESVKEGSLDLPNLSEDQPISVSAISFFLIKCANLCCLLFHNRTFENTLNKPYSVEIEKQTFEQLWTNINFFANSQLPLKWNFVQLHLNILREQFYIIKKERIDTSQNLLPNEEQRVMLRNLLNDFANNQSSPPELVEASIHLLIEGWDIFYSGGQAKYFAELIRKSPSELSYLDKELLNYLLAEYAKPKSSKFLEGSEGYIELATVLIESISKLTTVSLGHSSFIPSNLNDVLLEQYLKNLINLLNAVLKKQDSSLTLISQIIFEQCYQLLEQVLQSKDITKTLLLMKKKTLLGLLPNFILMVCIPTLPKCLKAITQSRKYVINLFFMIQNLLSKIVENERMAWVFDLHASIMLLIINIIKELLSFEISIPESSYGSLFMAKIFQSGKEEDFHSWENSEVGKFLQDFIQGVNLGQIFETKMKKEQIQQKKQAFNIPQKLSQNESVNRAIRTVVAAMLKHTNLTSKAISFSKSEDQEPPKFLLDIYMLAAKMNRWFIGQYQGTIVEDVNEKSYEELANLVEQSARFLFEFAPASSVGLEIEKLSPSEVKRKNLTASQELNDLKRAIDDLRLDVESLRDSWLQIPNEILSFVQSSDKERITKLKTVIQIRHERLYSREEAFHILVDLLDNLQNFPPQTRDHFIVQLHTIFQKNFSSNLFNYTVKLEGCSPKSLKALLLKVFKYFDSLIRQIARRDLESIEKSFLILGFAYKFSFPEEFQYLSNSDILKELWNIILYEKEPPSLRKLSWLLIRLFTTLCLDSKDKEFLLKVCALVSGYLEDLTKIRTITQRGIEILEFLCTSIGSSVGITTVLSPKLISALSVLFKIMCFEQVPPNTQISFLILKTFKTLIPHFSPCDVSPKSEQDFIYHIVKIIGQSYLRFFEPTETQSLVDDVIDIFKLMLEIPEWNTYLRKRISESFQVSKEILSKNIQRNRWNEEQKYHFWLFMSSIVVLGEPNLYPCIGRSISTSEGDAIIVNMDDETIYAIQPNNIEFININPDKFSILRKRNLVHNLIPMDDQMLEIFKVIIELKSEPSNSDFLNLLKYLSLRSLSNILEDEKSRKNFLSHIPLFLDLSRKDETSKLDQLLNIEDNIYALRRENCIQSRNFKKQERIQQAQKIANEFKFKLDECVEALKETNYDENAAVNLILEKSEKSNKLSDDLLISNPFISVNATDSNPTPTSDISLKSDFPKDEKKETKENDSKSSLPKLTQEEVSLHTSAKDAWIIIDGKVLDVSEFLDHHPGGKEILLELCGGDGTKFFEEAQHSIDARFRLKSFVIGELEKNTFDGAKEFGKEGGSSDEDLFSAEEGEINFDQEPTENSKSSHSLLKESKLKNEKESKLDDNEEKDRNINLYLPPGNYLNSSGSITSTYNKKINAKELTEQISNQISYIISSFATKILLKLLSENEASVQLNHLPFQDIISIFKKVFIAFSSQNPKKSGPELQQLDVLLARRISDPSFIQQLLTTINTFLSSIQSVLTPQIYILESEHPYPNNANISDTIVFEGASSLRIIFHKFATERNYDELELKSKDFSISLSGNTLPDPIEIQGNYISYRFISDSSNNDWGYLISIIGECHRHIECVIACWLIEFCIKQNISQIYSPSILKELVTQISLVDSETREEAIRITSLFVKNKDKYITKPDWSCLEDLSSSAEQLLQRIFKGSVISHSLSRLLDLMVNLPPSNNLLAESIGKEIPCLWKVFGTNISPLKGEGCYTNVEIGLIGRPNGIRFAQKDQIQLSEPITLNDKWFITLQFQYSPSIFNSSQEVFTLVADSEKNSIFAFKKENSLSMIPSPSLREASLTPTEIKPQSQTLIKPTNNEKSPTNPNKVEVSNQWAVNSTDGIVLCFAFFSPETKLLTSCSHVNINKLSEGWHSLRLSFKANKLSVQIDNILADIIPFSYHPTIEFIGNSFDKTEPFNIPIADLSIQMKRVKPLPILDCLNSSVVKGSTVVKSFCGILKISYNEVEHTIGVRSRSQFPSFYVPLFVTQGKWYYELQILDPDVIIQIGWANRRCECNEDADQGVGDNTNSWAYDGYRARKYHGEYTSWGLKWNKGDIVGALLDTNTKEISFSLNGENLGIAFENVDVQGGLFPAVTLKSSKIWLGLSANSQKHRPSDYFPIDLTGFKYSPERKNNPTLQLIYTSLGFMKYFTGDGPLPESIQTKVEWNESNIKWTLAMDIQLCDLLDSARINIIEVNPISIKISDSQKLLYLLLGEIPTEIIHDRLRLIKEFNIQIAKILQFIDLGAPVDQEPLLVSYFYKTRPLIFQSVKSHFIASIIERTNSDESVPNVSLNRIQNMIVDQSHVESNQTVFSQLFRQMKTAGSAPFKNPKKFFGVSFEGEEGYDDGGPFRDALENVISDVSSASLGLFILCPNGRKSFGRNRDKHIVNPSSKSDSHLEMFHFLGKILGWSLRSGHKLALNFAPIFWKGLINDPTDQIDLENIDEFQVQLFKQLREDSRITPENFSEVCPYTWTTTLSDGSLIELKPNGKDILLTFEERMEYIDKVLKIRLNESKEQINSIREGINEVVPLPLLNVLTWHQLENVIVGTTEVSTEFLKKHAKYEGFSPSDDLVKWFWETFDTFTPAEKVMFMKFVYGQAQIPNPSQHVLILQELEKNKPDLYLPQAATCYFTLKIPRYSSQIILREKLLLAITSCFVMGNY